MSTIPQLAQAMQTLLTTTADTLARQTGFVQRQRTLSGATFAQALVFSWLADPQVTVEGRSQIAQAARGLAISPQGLEQRLTETAATFLYRLLEAERSRRWLRRRIPSPSRFLDVSLASTSTNLVR